MSPVKGTTKRPTYLLPIGLLEISRPHASSRRMPLTVYGRHAIMLHNQLSLEGFDPTFTKLVRSTQAIPLPELATELESTERRPTAISLPNEHVAYMERFASQSGITVHERAAQAFRLANFIVGQVQPGDGLMLQYKNRSPMAVQSSLA